MINGSNIQLVHRKNKKHETVLNKVSFRLEKGRITSFIGPSGAGKTSLLKCIANLHTHYAGDINFYGKDTKKLQPIARAGHIGFVLQQFALFPHLTVLQNCTHPLIVIKKMSLEEAEFQAWIILQSLKMTEYQDAYPLKLSGGQQQRAAIARALVLEPEVLLLDEPTSALDPDSKAFLEAILQELIQKGLTVGLSSHDMPFIRRIMDRIYFMEQGSIVEEYDQRHNNLLEKKKIGRFLNHI
jgi:polar amino acid transport system ATP-binding protein